MVRSFRGRDVDMIALAKRHEDTIALGNGPTVNTRGDLIGRNGKIIKTREEQIREYEESLRSMSGNVSMKDPSAKTALERTIEKYSAKPKQIVPSKKQRTKDPEPEPRKEEPKKEDITWDE